MFGAKGDKGLNDMRMTIKRKFGDQHLTVATKLVTGNNGFKKIEDWMGWDEILLVFEGRKKPLCVLTYDLLEFLVDHFEPTSGSKLLVDRRAKIDRLSCFPYRVGVDSVAGATGSFVGDGIDLPQAGVPE